MNVTKASFGACAQVLTLDDPEEAVDAEVAALDAQLKQMLDPDEYAEFQRKMARCDYDPEAASRSF